MRRVGPREFSQALQRRGLPPRAIGDYSEGDPNIANPQAYSEREVFRGMGSGSVGPTGVAYETFPVPVVRNKNFFNLIQFSFSSTEGSRLLLPANEFRCFLSIQNQSTADNMYVNFTTEAGVNVGIELYPAQALIYDQVVPYNSITVYVNSATNQPGVVVEGALQL